MKIIIHSLLFILTVGIFAVTSDKLSTIEQKEMTQQEGGPQSPLSDEDFITGMIEHHDGAIAMSKNVLTKSKRPELKQLAQNIITAQSSEIDQMYEWRKGWFNESAHIEMRMGEEMPSMAIDLGSADSEFDRRYLDAMIKHHEGAITMAKQVLLPTDRAEIHDLAKNIITTQTSEITIMQNYLKEWYAK
ncbi:DUF305 domain-containing protein [Candidatus Woesebacteria bacterium]|nr:DUF305 domain-containing protein [Candidatus Woesebacteria bacterium]